MDGGPYERPEQSSELYGGLTSGEIELLAAIAEAGMDPFRWIDTKDEEERFLMEEIAIRFDERRQQLMSNQANLIADAVGKVFG